MVLYRYRINKYIAVRHIVKHVQCCSFVVGFRDLFWVLHGQCFKFGALYQSKSGLIHKHSLKHTVRVSEACGHIDDKSFPAD